MAVSSSTRKRISKKNATNVQKIVVDSLPTLEIDRNEVDTTSIPNMRTSRNQEDFQDLVANIRQNGLRQNPGVWQRDAATIKAITEGILPGNPFKKYDLLCGFGRWQAAEIIYQETAKPDSGFEKPRFATMRFGVVGAETPREVAIDAQYDENHYRENLSTEDEYKFIAKLRETMTLEEIALKMRVSVRFLVQRCNFYEKAAVALVQCVRDGILNFSLASEVQEKLGAGKPTPADLESQEIVARQARSAFDDLWLKEAIALEEAQVQEVQAIEETKEQEKSSAADALKALEEGKPAVKAKGKPRRKKQLGGERPVAAEPKDSTIARKTSASVKAALAAQLAKQGKKTAPPTKKKDITRLPWTIEEISTAVAFISKRKPEMHTYERGVYETLKVLLGSHDQSASDFLAQFLKLPPEPSIAESALSSAIKNAKQEANNLLAISGK